MTGAAARRTFIVLSAAGLLGGWAKAAAPASSPPGYRKIKAVDADNHSVQLNRPGVVTIVVGTSEDSQDAARQAGIAMYPFEGRPDFQLIVVVDLRNSMATWVPSIVLNKMKENMDVEATELKEPYLKNGNRSNPRPYLHVIPDFTGTICPLLGWPDNSDSLRVIIYGADGREFRRFDPADDMAVLHNGVRDALQAKIEAGRARNVAATKASYGVRTSALNPPLPPLPPPLPVKGK